MSTPKDKDIDLDADVAKDADRPKRDVDPDTAKPIGPEPRVQPRPKPDGHTYDRRRRASVEPNGRGQHSMEILFRGSIPLPEGIDQYDREEAIQGVIECEGSAWHVATFGDSKGDDYTFFTILMTVAYGDNEEPEYIAWSQLTKALRPVVGDARITLWASNLAFSRCEFRQGAA